MVNRGLNFLKAWEVEVALLFFVPVCDLSSVFFQLSVQETGLVPSCMYYLNTKRQHNN